MSHAFSTKPILVLVHPGSACGSADMNLGKFEARAARAELAYELDHWHGTLLVIDGELSDELPWYPQLDRAITECLARGAHLPVPSRRVLGDDPAQVESAREFAAQIGPAAAAGFRVTGAWYHPEDGGGCVGSVVDELRRLGYPAEVSDNAVALAWEADADDEAAVETEGGSPGH